ncbi:MAG: hypothetical protein QM648_09250 [Solirubrobacterales bacterium]
MPDENDIAPAEDSAGSLADAIAEHLALKKEHGADPESVETELEDALSPARRDEPEPEAVSPEPEPEPTPEPESEPRPAEAEIEEHVEVFQEIVEDGSEADPDPITEAEVASSVEEPKPGEITGTIEFEFGEEESKDEPEPEPDSADEHDLLEDTPDFFEETPEHDKLWFDEAPPRKFDF